MISEKKLSEYSMTPNETISKIIKLCDTEFHRTRRYHIVCSVILLTSISDNLPSIIKQDIRQLDLLFELDEQLSLIILPHTDHEGAELFARNLTKYNKPFKHTIVEYHGEEPVIIVNAMVQSHFKDK